jgi:hypothetical protein
MEDEFENDYEIETTAEEDTDLDEPEVEANPLMDMVNAIGDGDLSSASNIFSSQLNDRLSDAIEQERISDSSNIFGGDQEEMVDA